MFFRRDGSLQTPVGQALSGIQVFVCSQPATTSPIPPSPLINLYAAPSSNNVSVVSATWELGVLELVLASLPADLVVGSYIGVTASNPATFDGIYLVEAVDSLTDTVTVTLATNPGTYVGSASVATSVLPNPVVTDGNGNYFFYAPAADYTLVFFDPLGNVATAVFPDQEVVSPGGGTVTSVGLAGDGVIFNSTIPGSPVTTSGVMSLLSALLAQNALFVLSGPLSGGAAAPTFKSLSSLLSAAGAGAGTVTSVAITLSGSALFTLSVSGSPITGSGTIALTINPANQAANTALMGPTSGGSGPLTARQFVAADLAVVGPVMLQTITTLSSAQLLALFGTPVQLVPAPGAGFTIVPISIVIEVFGGSAAYTDGGAGAVELTIGSAVVQLASNAVFTTPLSNTQIQRLAGFPATDTAGAPPTDDNGAMQITKVTNNFAAGNGTAKVIVSYIVVPTT